MNFLRIYIRVLKELGSEYRLAVVLVLANLALAAAQFAEPVLFGRIIDKLAGAQKEAASVRWEELFPLIAAWVSFGLFNIGASVPAFAQAAACCHRRLF